MVGTWDMYYTVLWGWGLKEPSQRRLIQRSLGPRGLKNWPKEPGPKEPGQKGFDEIFNRGSFVPGHFSKFSCFWLRLLWPRFLGQAPLTRLLCLPVFHGLVQKKKLHNRCNLSVLCKIFLTIFSFDYSSIVFL